MYVQWVGMFITRLVKPLGYNSQRIFFSPLFYTLPDVPGEHDAFFIELLESAPMSSK